MIIAKRPRRYVQRACHAHRPLTVVHQPLGPRGWFMLEALPSWLRRTVRLAHLAHLVTMSSHRRRILACATCPSWAEARIKIARMTLTVKLNRNWSSFQLANCTPPLSVTGSTIAPSTRMREEVLTEHWGSDAQVWALKQHSTCIRSGGMCRWLAMWRSESWCGCSLLWQQHVSG